MKRYCHYHPTSPAIWHCPSCDLYFDKLCMPDGNEKQQQGNCPHCQQSMTFLSKRKDMPPFWKTPEQFLKAPFKSDPLFLVVLIACCSSLMNLHPLLAIVLGAALSLLLTNYALVLTHRLIKANRSHRQFKANKDPPPGIAAAFHFKRFKESLSISIILWLCFAPSIILLYSLSGMGSVMYSVITLPLLPSVILVLINVDHHSGDIATAWLSIIKKMGLSYLALVSYFALAYVSSLFTIDILRALLPNWALAPLATTIISYLIISLFSVLAYILIRYESFTSSIQEKATDTSAKGSPERFDADLDIAIKDGNYPEALKLLNGSLKNKKSDLRVHQLYTLLIEHKDLKGLEDRSHLFLELLLGRGQKLAAYELIELLRNNREGFLIHDIALSLQLAKTFHEMKEYKLILWLTQDAHKRFDPSHDLAELYLLAAKTILSRSKRPEKALDYLDYVVNNFPDTELKKNAERLVQHLQQRT